MQFSDFYQFWLFYSNFSVKNLILSLKEEINRESSKEKYISVYFYSIQKF